MLIGIVAKIRLQNTYFVGYSGLQRILDILCREGEMKR